MNIDLENLTPSRIKLSCAVTPEEVAVEKDKVVKKFVSTRTIPGFRKGKAPAARILQVFGGDITTEALNNSINVYYTKAVEEKELKVFETVEITDVKPTDDLGIEFVATIDLEPEFDLPQYEGIPVDNADTAVTDEQAAEELKSFQKSLSKFEDFTEETVAVAEDMLNISYKGTYEGKPLAEAIPEASAYAEKDASWCTVGSEYYMIPGLPDALVGAKLGTEGTYTVTFAEDFYKEELRGKVVEYAYTVKEGRHLAMPELTDEMLAPLGIETVDVLKERINTYLESNAKNADKERRIGQIIEFLTKAVSFELPQAELDRTTERNLDRLIQTSMHRGASKEDIETEREKLMEFARESAEQQMRSSFVIGKIGTALETKIDDKEFNAFLNMVFQRQRTPESEIQKIIKDRDTLRMYYSEALRNKILDELLAKATPTEGVGA